MATQARITLVALNGDAPLPERTLTLHPHLRTIQIGRASKSPSKGLQAAVDNAWFDSPVMSRNHAEICLDTESNVVKIRDIGSMHGTFINDTQLGRDDPSILSNGDIVVFGAEVKRNLDTFPACVFQVNFVLLPFKATNSYTFPEADEEDYEISEDENEGNEEPSSEHGVSIESPPHKVSQAIDAIDLTRDDSPASFSVAEVDSAGQTRIEKNLMNIIAGRPADINRHADPVSVAIYNGIPPILLDSEDEDAHFSSDSDDQSDKIEYGDSASSEEESMDEEQDLDNEEGSNHEMDEEIDEASGLASMGLYSLLDAPIPESNIRTIIAPFEDEEDDEVDDVEEADDDEESDFSLSDAGAEGIHALFNDGLIGNEGESYLEEQMDEKNDSGSVVADSVRTKDAASEERLETPKHVTFACFSSEQLPEAASTYAHFNDYQRTFGNLDIPSNPPMSARQPSPSDAAMVKTANPSTTVLNHTANPIKVYHFPSQQFQNLTAQSLGDKTGKHAFFAAREDNKAKLHDVENSQTPSWFQNEGPPASLSTEEKKERSTGAAARFRERRRRKEEEAAMAESAKIVLPVPSTIRATNLSIPSLSALPYLEDHSQATRVVRTPSPELDMTSAVSFNESKASLAATNKHTSRRSALRINDIIDGAVDDHTATNIKRKADDISEAIENEVRVWASSSTALNNIEVTPGTSTASPADGQDKFKTTSTSNASEQRPAKRLRKIVESVGYVALGGATLFGALVLSAPDFL